MKMNVFPKKPGRRFSSLLCVRLPRGNKLSAGFPGFWGLRNLGPQPSSVWRCNVGAALLGVDSASQLRAFLRNAWHFRAGRRRAALVLLQRIKTGFRGPPIT